jgi:hypothetical protein
MFLTNKKLALLAATGFSLITSFAYAQTRRDMVGRETDRVITTAVPFLTIAPDARHSAMGDAGVATSPDANSIHWNAAKLAFAENDFAGSLSYSPWLRNLGVNDIFIAYLSGYKKLRKEDAIGVSLRYFNLGNIQFTNIENQVIYDFNPNEFALDAAYSRQLSENLSIGATLRYIHSNLAGNYTNATDGAQARPANTASIDLTAYWNKEISLGGAPAQLSFGGGIFNLGPKVSYTDNNRQDFIPITLRLGGGLTYELDQYNKISLFIDANKLMVPSPDTTFDTKNDKPLFAGMFGSFTDAKGGAKEEWREIMWSFGTEYWYDNLFAVRAGYFHESMYKGARQYFTAGVGIRYQKFGLDFSYLVPTSGRNHPLAETVRFSLMFSIDKKAEVEEDSVVE